MTRHTLAKLLHPRIYRLGQAEAYDTIGRTYRHPDTLRSLAYDLGRESADPCPAQ